MTLILNTFLLNFLLFSLSDGNKYNGGIYMVFEYMDHDLTGLSDRPGMRFTVAQIKVCIKKVPQIYVCFSILQAVSIFLSAFYFSAT